MAIEQEITDANVSLGRFELNGPPNELKGEVSEISDLDEKPRVPITVDDDFDEIGINIVMNKVNENIAVQRSSQAIWRDLNSKYEQDKEVFENLAPGTPYIDVNQKDYFISETRRKFEHLLRLLPDFKGTDRWDSLQMENMFGKGLNPTSLITTRETSQWFVDKLELGDKDSLDIMEVGIGAGWSTVMLFQELRSVHPERMIHVFSCDMSLHAIAATQVLLESQGIDYIVVKNKEELAELRNAFKKVNFSGVVLIPGIFEDRINWFADDSLDGLYSSHGTAYFLKEEYEGFFKEMQNKLVNRGLIIADSLHPLYTTKLSLPVTILQMLFPNALEKYFTSRNIEHVFNESTEKSTSKYFSGQEVKSIRIFNTYRSSLILKWSNYLIKNFKFGKFLKTKKSLDITMKVVDAYRNDVYPSFLLPELAEHVSPGKFKTVEGRPENFPIFMDSIGLRLYK